MGRTRFSVIIPVLHEADRINQLVEHIRSQSADTSYEIIVVDGAPERDTISAVQTVQHDMDIRLIASGKGRAIQMNAGASVSTGDILVFLHADTSLPAGGLEKIEVALCGKEYVAGAFDLGIGSGRAVFKLIGYLASIRSRLTRIPYGDQAIFIRREYFKKIEGYPDVPIMEDVELMRRIKKQGARVIIISDRVVTSPRRWEQEGVIYSTLRNRLIMILYLLGMSTYRLHKFYRSDSHGFRSD